MARVSVCVSIYNNIENFKKLYRSLMSNCSFDRHDLEFLLHDDGSQKPSIKEKSAEFCAEHGIHFIASPSNRGVAASWNILCQSARSDIVALLNDDLLCGSEDWVGEICSYFEANPKLGIVYWCQRIVDPRTGDVQRLTNDSIHTIKAGSPLLRHNFCGAFFAFRRSIWRDIVQPDGSVGFWEDVNTYGEEFDFSAETLKRGYFILQLPFTWDHLHSQTFAANPNRRKRGSYSTYLSAGEFEEFCGIKPRPLIVRAARRLIRKSMIEIPMGDYSQAMLQKKWRGKTILGFEGEQFLQQMRKDGFPSAFRTALERGSFSLPDKISGTPSMSFLDPDETSLS
jgi:GT2 family glycosyltransferase